MCFRSELLIGLAAARLLAGCNEEPPDCPLRSNEPLVIDLAAADGATVALLADGRALCWGQDHGPCGLPGKASQQTPVFVRVEDCFSSITPGEGSISGGITAFGQAVVWGTEAVLSPAAGDGPLDGPGSTATFAILVGAARPIQLALTSGEGIAVTEDGTLYYWGSTPAWFIERPTAYPAPAAVTMGSAEANNVCFLTVEGDVYCFGANRSGILGVAPSEGFSHEPHRINLPAPAKEADIGYDAACSLLQTEEVFCWGLDAGSKVLGDGTIEYSEQPLRIEGLGGVADLIMEQGGPCVLDHSGQALCWGTSFPDPDQPAVYPPEPWRPDLAFSRLAIGIKRLCGLTLDGRVYCKGLNAGIPNAVEGFVDIEGAIAGVQ